MKKLWVVIAIIVLALILVGYKGTSDKYDLSDLISEKMTANYLYTELAERYPNDEMFANLAEEAARDIDVLEEAAARQSISIVDAKADNIDIPETKADALSYAVLFEQAETRMLNKMIKNEEDAYLKEILGDILKSSEGSYNMIKTASDEANPLVVRGCTRCRITKDGQGCQMPK